MSLANRLAERGNPQSPSDFGGAVAQQDFRDAMASLAATACLVTAQGEDQRLGRTVTAALSLGVTPPGILISIDAGSALASLIQKVGAFSFAMLSESQQAVADAFAGKVTAEHRFDHGNWQDWPSGQPRLLDSVVTMDCLVITEVKLAGHILFTGQPRQIANDDSRWPLIWHRRRYNSVCPLELVDQREKGTAP